MQHGLCDRRSDLFHTGGCCGREDCLQQGGTPTPEQGHQRAQVRVPDRPRRLLMVLTAQTHSEMGTTDSPDTK